MVQLQFSRAKVSWGAAYSLCLLLGACSQPEAELPDDQIEAAATCFAATLMAEFNAEANLNPAELGGVAMRAMAKAVELGPVGDVIKACSERYGRG